jgi:hypothetical protein
MKRFLIQTSVENAEGSQTWYVDAETEAEALKKYNDGDCNMYQNEVDVTSLGEPELAGETSLDDFGYYVTTPQRTWVGLTDEDKMVFLAKDFGGNRLDAMDWAEERLKEKNNVSQ